MKLRWTPTAARHLEEAFNYLTADDPGAAVKLVQRILSTIELLEQHSLLGRSGRVPGTRELVIGRTPFVVVYRVYRDEVHILAVLHSFRRWPEAL